MFFEFICLFFALMDTIICLPSSDYLLNSDRQSAAAPTGYVSTRVLENALHLQHLLDNKVPTKSAHGSPFLDSNAPSVRKPSFAPSSLTFTKTLQNEQLLQQLRDEEVIATNAPKHRERRGIVLIDEDFNVPPERGVKQAWGDGDVGKNETESDEKSTEEGSGQTEETSSTRNRTAEQLHISTDKIKVTPTQEYEKTASTSEFSDKVASSIEHTEDIEGSGELTKTSPITEEQDGKSAIKACFKRTCNSEDLTLSPGISRKVPEGTNLTLSCSSVNASARGLLKLYKYNESDSSLLEESNKEEKLIFDILLSQRHHSGTYMCLKLTEESCCHQQLDIIIYEVPNYKTHLIVIGLIAAISLFTCILLGIYRRFKTKNYQVQMELQNMEKPVLF